MAMKRYGIWIMAGLWGLVIGSGMAAAGMAVDSTGLGMTEPPVAFWGTEAGADSGVDTVVGVDSVSVDATGFDSAGVVVAAARPKLHAVGRVREGANWLRWAPDTPEGWALLLRRGVVVARYAYVADTVLFAEWRRPPVSSADSLAFAEAVDGTGDPWTAAMGELLFADSLEIGPSGGRFSRLSQELEQRQMRFAMALLISDRSYAAACAGLLGWRDSLGGLAAVSAGAVSRASGGGVSGSAAFGASVGAARATSASGGGVSGSAAFGASVGAARATSASGGGVSGASMAVDAYLYRIYVPEADMDTAVVLLRPQEGLLLPPRTLLAADVRDRTVTLRWNSRFWGGLCVGYYVERAVGNGPFEACNRHPIDVLQRDRAGAEELYYIDSLPDRRKVRYRVMGVDLFGDRYQVTGETETMAEAAGLSVPQMVQAVPVAHGGVEVRWRYPAEQEKALARFEVFVKDSMYGAYRSMGTVKPKTRRLAVPAGSLSASAYFSVAAYNSRGEVSYSPACFHQLKDTTPPLPPIAPVAYADTGGGVHISWRPSPSEDAAGYLVLKSRRAEGGLPWQVHAEPIADTVYTDSIDALMWQAAYYYVAAVDHSGNISALSAPVTVYPNRPNPMSPPLFDGCEADGKRLKIRWFNSMDSHAATCALYAAVDGGEPQLVARRRLGTPRPEADSLYYPLPKGRAFDTRYRFSLAVEAPTGDTVWAPQPYDFLHEAELAVPRLLAWPEREKRCVAVQWQTPPYAPLAKAYLYRKSDDGSYRLLQVLTPPELDAGLYVDKAVSMNTNYIYRVQFQTADGRYTPFACINVIY